MTTALATPDDSDEHGKPAKGRKPKRRANGEGSIFPYRNGYAAYVWVTTPTGERKKRWAYGKTREAVHTKYVKLLGEAAKGPVPTSVPTVERYLTYWLSDVIEPNREPQTYAHYETMARLYVVPALGRKRLDRLTVRDVQTWLNQLPNACQCCAQGKDAARPERHTDARKRQRCCAIGRCCKSYPSRRTIQAARNTLRAALSHAQAEEILSRNVAGMAKLPTMRKRARGKSSWSVDEARRFLESARSQKDPLYAAWVLILVLGLRKGEVLGLRWEDVNLDAGELSVSMQLQRVRGELIHKERTKTEDSTDVLPLPEICVTALRIRQKRQESECTARNERWTGKGLVFTTRTGRPIEPRNVNRSFAHRCACADVRPIRVHDTRHTCGSLLAALDIHPRTAMQILRHSQIGITMEVYTQVPNEVTREALKRLGDRLTSPTQHD
ncbi:site-specific integrase [Actinomadura craniellae]|uniref:Site-specific integrase n=1 Tax=Actinomadura craniellae TaxID=2231787 RepID=A0A365HBI9_9ACTN|nr:site-specific integrase [Actinomadura craniellae]RAY16382.1 site-specific integrase [Actinomadura craniellae]